MVSSKWSRKLYCTSKTIYFVNLDFLFGGEHFIVTIRTSSRNNLQLAGAHELQFFQFKLYGWTKLYDSFFHELF